MLRVETSTSHLDSRPSLGPDEASIVVPVDLDGHDLSRFAEHPPRLLIDLKIKNPGVADVENNLTVRLVHLSLTGAHHACKHTLAVNRE